MYICDNTPRYRFIRNSDNDIYNFINNILIRDKKIKMVLHTDFKKISNMKQARYLVNYISKVVFYDEKNTYLYFEIKDNNQVSIINYNRDKIKSLVKSHQIIENDRKQKDILVKTTIEDIKK